MVRCRALVALFGAGALGAATCAACGRQSEAGTTTETRTFALRQEESAPPLPPRPGCGHALCGNDFFVDAALPTACAVGASCTLTLTLVATGAYHINEEYPYKFLADEVAGLRFLGRSEAGPNVFSKGANDWTRVDEKTGALAVTFRATMTGAKLVSGVFKLSVCSAQNCQLEQRQVRAPITVL